MNITILSLALFLQLSAIHAQEALTVWKAADAKSSDSVDWPEAGGGSSLTGPAGGVSIEPDQVHEKILRFDGSQEEPLSSQAKVMSASRVRVSATVKLEPDKAWGTILRFSGIELRHTGNRETVSLIVWPDEQDADESTPEISLPRRVGEWVTLIGTVEGNTMRLEMDGEAVEKQFTGQYKGASSILYGGLGAGRPFVGDLAEIRIEPLE